MKTKIKLTNNSQIPTTRDDAEALMNELANIANNQRLLQSRRDAEVLAINTKYEAGLSQCAEELKARTELLHAWAETNTDQFPKGLKSIKFTSGTLGFRTGTPKLSLLSRAFTWEKVLDLARKSGWVRTKVEVAKDTILAEHSAGTLDAEALRRLGLKVVRDESFYCEPDLSAFEPRQTVATN